MNLELNDKIIIVTGGANGIGNAICRTLVDEGAVPVIVDKDKENSEKTVKEITDKGGKAFSVVADLTIPGACENAVKAAVHRFGRIDCLVNNAGTNDNIGLEDGNYETFIASLHKNLTHYYLTAHFAVPYLKKSKGAAIVNIGSKVAVTGQGHTSGYAAANGGRCALTREWAVELLPFGIRVNAVLPSECLTPMYQRWLKNFDNPEQKLQEITLRIPLENRMTTPEEIAQTVVFLLSPKSSHTTGELLYVDGGYVHLDRAISGTKPLRNS